MGYDTQFAIVYALALGLYAALLTWALPAIAATFRALVQRAWSAAQASAQSEGSAPHESLASMLASTASSRLRRAPDRERPTAKLWPGASHDRG